MKLNEFYKDKIILITGGCGSIGRRIVEELIKYDVKEIRIYDNTEYYLFREELKYKENKKIKLIFGDIRDKTQLSTASRGTDFIFHAAALKHVPIGEYNPSEIVKTNILGTMNVIEVAHENNVKNVVNISTDKAINPVNTMGASKMIGEKLIVSPILDNFQTKYACVRFGNVLDSDGSVIPIFREQIKKGGPVTVTHKDMTRYFMSIKDAVGLIVKACSLMQGREIFILKMKAMKIIDLAEVLIDELAPKYNINTEDIDINFIGLRPGEKLYEALIFDEEVPFCEEKEDMYVVRPQIYAPHYKQDKPETYKDLSNLHSDHAKLLTKEEIKSDLVKHKVLIEESENA